MESDDEVVERQKLVETEEEPTSQVTTAPQSAPKSGPTPASPVAVPKIIVKSINSGETTRSRNSGTLSIERNANDKGNTTARLSYVNERRNKAYYMQGAGSGGNGGSINDERFEFKPRPRKLLRDEENNYESDHSLNAITVIGNETNDNNDSIDRSFENENDHHNVRRLAEQAELAANKRKHSLNASGSVKSGRGVNPIAVSNTQQCNENDTFDERPIKHHSFVSEVPDVKHMERALLGLLDDFHSGKLKAFGFGCTMDQMTKIREQQESLAKLHFELASAEEDSLEHGNDLNAVKAQEHMLQLVQRLEQLSISIEQLQTNNNGL